MNLRAPVEELSSPHEPTVFVVDPDLAIHASLEPLVRREGWRPALFTSAEEFLAQPRFTQPSCLVSDVRLPGLSGLELQARLADRPEVPLIFLTSDFDISITVRAMRAGAVEFLTKPFSKDAMLNAIRCAMERSNTAVREESELRTLRERYGWLSRREREVMALVVAGLLNKQVAWRLGIAEVTVKAHRGQVMRKMGAGSLARLVSIAAKLKINALVEWDRPRAFRPAAAADHAIACT